MHLLLSSLDFIIFFMRASVKKQIQNYLDPFVVQVGMNIERVLPLAVSLLAATAWVERFHEIMIVTDIIFVTSSTCSASVKYFWICVKLYRIRVNVLKLSTKMYQIAKKITQEAKGM